MAKTKNNPIYIELSGVKKEGVLCELGLLEHMENKGKKRKIKKKIVWFRKKARGN